MLLSLVVCSSTLCKSMGRDNDDPKKDNDGKDWTYDGDRSRFRATVERIESAMLEIGGENLVLHWQGQRSSE